MQVSTKSTLLFNLVVLCLCSLHTGFLIIILKALDFSMQVSLPKPAVPYGLSVSSPLTSTQHTPHSTALAHSQPDFFLFDFHLLT